MDGEHLSNFCRRCYKWMETDMSKMEAEVLNAAHAAGNRRVCMGRGGDLQICLNITKRFAVLCTHRLAVQCNFGEFLDDMSTTSGSSLLQRPLLLTKGTVHWVCCIRVQVEDQSPPPPPLLSSDGKWYGFM